MAGEAGHAFHGSEEGELFRFIGDFYDSVIEMDPAVSVGTGKSLVFRTFVRKECGSLGARKQRAHALGEGGFYHDGSLSPPAGAASGSMQGNGRLNSRWLSDLPPNFVGEAWPRSGEPGTRRCRIEVIRGICRLSQVRGRRLEEMREGRRKDSS